MSSDNTPNSLLAKLENATTIVVSAPSGCGKTTLNRRLIAEHPDLVEMSVSHTARSPRRDEIDKKHYHFIQNKEFEQHIKSERFLEHAMVFGNYYGTSKDEVARIHQLGKTALLEIDVQGWLQAKEKLSNCCAIFILPPTVASLWERLSSRGTETETVKQERLAAAKSEIAQAQTYDYFIVNHDLDSAYDQLKTIIIDRKFSGVSAEKGLDLARSLLQEF